MLENQLGKIVFNSKSVVSVLVMMFTIFNDIFINIFIRCKNSMGKFFFFLCDIGLGCSFFPETEVKNSNGMELKRSHLVK
jgi:hypothetical protein